MKGYILSCSSAYKECCLKMNQICIKWRSIFLQIKNSLVAFNQTFPLFLHSVTPVAVFFQIKLNSWMNFVSSTEGMFPTFCLDANVWTSPMIDSFLEPIFDAVLVAISFAFFPLFGITNSVFFCENLDSSRRFLIVFCYFCHFRLLLIKHINFYSWQSSLQFFGWFFARFVKFVVTFLVKRFLLIHLALVRKSTNHWLRRLDGLGMQRQLMSTWVRTLWLFIWEIFSFPTTGFCKNLWWFYYEDFFRLSPLTITSATIKGLWCQASKTNQTKRLQIWKIID